MGVRAYKNPRTGATRYRVTLFRDRRRVADQRLPAGTTAEQAELYYSNLVRDWFNRERLGLQPPPLISEVIREYAQRILPTLKSPRYFHDCARAVAPFVVGRRLDELHDIAPEVARALAHQAPATVTHRLYFLKSLARYAVKWRLADRDWSLGLEIPSFNNSRQFYIGKQDVARILRHMINPGMRRICWQLFYSGMRRGELWRAELLKTPDGPVWSIATSKNGDPRRVPVPLPLMRIATPPEYTRDAVSRAFKRAARAAGLGHLRLHDLRHSHASMLLNAGANLSIIGAILGHRDSRSSKRYAHLSVNTARAWMNFAATGGEVLERFKGSAGMQPAPPRKKAA